MGPGTGTGKDDDTVIHSYNPSDEKDFLRGIVSIIINGHSPDDLLRLHLYLDSCSEDETFFSEFTRQLAKKCPEAFTTDSTTKKETV